MQGHEIINLFKDLKLYGMADAFDETVIKGVQRGQAVQEILGQLCRVEAADRKVRSIRYQMRIARFPVAKDLDGFKFSDSPVNEPLIEVFHPAKLLLKSF